jgi:polar amino acid transport system permease protein
MNTVKTHIRSKRLHWLDWVLIALIGVVCLVVWARIDGSFNYAWRWDIIPNYILRRDTDANEWVPNLLLEGFFTTIRLSIYASAIALVLGTVLGVARCSRNLTTRMLARTYLELLRNIPPIVIIFIFYFFLSEQIIEALDLERWARGIARQEDNAIWTFLFGDMRRFPELLSGCIVLALFESAFIGEIIRTGIQSVPIGQLEAAQSIGLGKFSQMRYIVLPQAFGKVLPPLANQFIVLIKDSAFISLISVQELTFRTTELVATTRAVFEAWLTTAAMYFVICFGLSLLFRKLESASKMRDTAS